MKKELIKKPFFVTAILFVIILILQIGSLVSVVLNLNNISSFLFILIYFFNLFGFVGFFYLGKKYKNKILMNVSIAGFILYIFIFFMFFIFGSFFISNLEKNSEVLNETLMKLEKMKDTDANMVEAELWGENLKLFYPLIIFVFLVLFLSAIYQTFFGISLIKLKNVNYANIVGVLEIVNGWLLITIVGIFLYIPFSLFLTIFKIKLFFEQSKVFKERRKT